MTVTHAAIAILKQLDDLIGRVLPQDFRRPSETLGGATIGRHIRHTLEFFACFESGYHKGVINYDKRSHDALIETDKTFASALISRIIVFVQELHPNKQLTLEVGYDTSADTYQHVNTNSTRELVYNIEHAVHHMAMIRIAVNEIAPYAVLHADFGVAASTLRYAALAGQKPK